MNIQEAIKKYCLERNLVLLSVKMKPSVAFTIKNPFRRDGKFQINLGNGIRAEKINQDTFSFEIYNINKFTKTYK